MMKKAMIIVLLLVPVVLNAQFGYKYKTSYFNNEFINTHTIPDSTRKIKYNDYTKHREFFHVFPVIGGLIIPDKLEVYDFGAFGGYGYFIQNRWLISVDATFIYYYYHVRPSPEYKDYQNFEQQKHNFNIKVNKWDTILSIKNKLCKEKLLNNCLFADVFFYLNWPDKIITGNYTIKNVSLSWLFQQLKKWPPVNYEKFTIIPWDTIFDIANKLETYNPKNKNIFLRLSQDETFIKKLQNNYPELKKFWNIKSIEGFLYPDTYFFKKNDLKSELFSQLLIKTAIKNFIKKTKKLNWQITTI